MIHIDDQHVQQTHQPTDHEADIFKPSTRLSDGNHFGQSYSEFTGFRILILGWCLWLLGSWAISLTMSSTLPAVRWMIFSSTIGLMCVWPAFRLSQAPWMIGYTLSKRLAVPFVIMIDWIGLMIIFQAVLWPLYWMAGWSLRQGILLDLSIGSWSFLTGLIIVFSVVHTKSVIRMTGMVFCLLLLSAEPLVLWLLTTHSTSFDRWSMCWSPVQMLWLLTANRSDFNTGDVEPFVIIVIFVAISAWLIHLCKELLCIKLLSKSVETPRIQV